MSASTALSVSAGAAVLVTLHLAGGHLRFLSHIPRRRWLSFAGGASVAYVFVLLLPKLAAGADLVADDLDVGLGEHAVWLVALTGMIVFYGLEVASRSSKKRNDATGLGVYHASMAAYAVYNGLIGYQLHERAAAGLSALVLFVVAIGLHFLINDSALRAHHREPYHRTGRWILVVGLVAGAALGAITDVAPVAMELTRAVLAGGIILNVLKEELPAEAESRFFTFLFGAVAYSILLLAL